MGRERGRLLRPNPELLTMRRPKHRKVRRSTEEHVHDYTAHVPSPAFVRVSVTEVDVGPNTGNLIVDLERVTGTVLVRWTDEDGRPQAFALRHGEGS